MADKCYAEFAAYYDYYSNDAYLKKAGPHQLNYNDYNSDTDDEDYINDDYDFKARESKEKDSYIKLNKNDGYVKERSNAKILRYKKYKRGTNDYYRVQLMLFLPWTKESVEIE